jgi:hypothetical protein
MTQNKKQWKFMCAVRDIVLKNGGIIFGGFVRDTIIHDHNAMQYYEVSNNNYLYTNPHYLSKCFDRTIIPHDIDCNIPHDRFNDFATELTKKKIVAETIFVRDPHKYLPHIRIQDDTLRHVRMMLKLDMTRVNKVLNELPIDIRTKDFKVPTIYVDIIVSSKHYEEPFLGVPDFECNGLYLTSHGICLTDFVSSKKDVYRNEVEKQRIIKDIIEKKAMYLAPDPDSETSSEILIKRISKLLKNGWILQDDILTTVREKYDGHCIICHGKFKEVHFKLHCCDGRYHGQCLQDALTKGPNAMRLTNECCLCKSEIATTESNLAYLLSKCIFPELK